MSGVMPIGIPELTQLKSSYSRLGLNTVERTLEPISESDRAYRLATNLRQTLEALDSIVRFDLSRSDYDELSSDSSSQEVCNEVASDFNSQAQSKLGQNIHTAFQAFKSAIQEIDNANDSVYSPQLTQAFCRTGRFLCQNLEPLLTEPEKKDLGELHSIHSVVTFQHLPCMTFKAPGLHLADAYSKYARHIDKNFLKGFYKQIGDYCYGELFPQILRQGFDLPDRVILNLQKGYVGSSFEYNKSTSKKPDPAFEKQFQAQFAQKIYNVVVDLFEQREVYLSRDKNFSLASLNTTIVVCSQDYLSESKKHAEQIEESLKKHNVNKLLQRIHIKNLKLLPRAYLAHQLFQSLFGSLDREIITFLHELPSGTLLDRDLREYSNRISRGIILIDSLADSHLKFDEINENFKRLLERYKKVTNKLKEFLDEHWNIKTSAATSSANVTLSRMVEYIKKEGLVDFNNYDQQKINRQLLKLLPPEDKDDVDSINEMFHEIFAQSFLLMMNQMLINIDPLDLRNIDFIRANIEMTVNKEGELKPEIKPSTSFKNNDNQYGEHFLRKYRDVIDEAIDEANDYFRENVKEILGEFKWSSLKQGTTMPLDMGIYFGDFRLHSGVPEFSNN